MKSAINSFRFAAFTFIFVLASGLANATDAPKKPAASMSIQYVGKYHNLPVFQLNLLTPRDEEVHVTVRDIDNLVLYSEILAPKTMTRKYALDVDLSEVSRIMFVITNKKTNIREVYQVTNSSYVVESVSVARL